MLDRCIDVVIQLTQTHGVQIDAYEQMVCIFFNPAEKVFGKFKLIITKHLAEYRYDV